MKDFAINYIQAIKELYNFFTQTFTQISNQWLDLKFIIDMMLMHNREFIIHNDRPSFERFHKEAGRYRLALENMQALLPEKREAFVGYSRFLAKLRDTNVNATTSTFLKNFYVTYDKQTKVLWDLVQEYTECIQKQLKFINEITLSKGGVKGTVRVVDDNVVSDWQSRSESTIEEGFKIANRARSVLSNMEVHLKYLSKLLSFYHNAMISLYKYYHDLFENLNSSWWNIKLIIPMLMNGYETFLTNKQKDTFLRFSDEVNHYRLELLRLSNILEESQKEINPIKQSLSKLKAEDQDEPIIRAMVGSLEQEFMEWLRLIAKVAADYRGTIVKLSSTVDMIVDDTNRIKITDMEKAHEWQANSELLWDKGQALANYALEKLKIIEAENRIIGDTIMI